MKRRVSEQHAARSTLGSSRVDRVGISVISGPRPKVGSQCRGQAADQDDECERHPTPGPEQSVDVPGPRTAPSGDGVEVRTSELAIPRALIEPSPTVRGAADPARTRDTLPPALLIDNCLRSDSGSYATEPDRRTAHAHTSQSNGQTAEPVGPRSRTDARDRHLARGRLVVRLQTWFGIEVMAPGPTGTARSATWNHRRIDRSSSIINAASAVTLAGTSVAPLLPRSLPPNRGALPTANPHRRTAGLRE